MTKIKWSLPLAGGGFLPVQVLYSSAKAAEAVISSQTALCRLGPEKRKSAASIAPIINR